MRTFTGKARWPNARDWQPGGAKRVVRQQIHLLGHGN
jgi:hypothetical protein